MKPATLLTFVVLMLISVLHVNTGCEPAPPRGRLAAMAVTRRLSA